MPSRHLRGFIINTPTVNIRRTTAAVIVWAMVMAVFGLAGRAEAAAPYVNPPGQNITINQTVVGPGGTIVIGVNGATPGDNINFYVHSAEVYLATYRANANGVASGPLKIPSSFSGPHTIVARDAVNGQSWSIAITVANSASSSSSNGSGSGGSGTSGGLPNTGAAVMGLGVLALILMTGGATLLLLGRRRVRSTH